MAPADDQFLEEEMREDDDFPDLVPADDQGELIDELEDLQEDDFPDLVRSDETGEFMDELDFLQDAEMVELAARHRQKIGQSPSAITVFTREDIETTGATNVIDLLRQVALVAPERSTRRSAGAAADAADRGVVADTSVVG